MFYNFEARQTNASSPPNCLHAVITNPFFATVPYIDFSVHCVFKSVKFFKRDGMPAQNQRGRVPCKDSFLDCPDPVKPWGADELLSNGQNFAWIVDRFARDLDRRSGIQLMRAMGVSFLQ